MALPLELAGELAPWSPHFNGCRTFLGSSYPACLAAGVLWVGTVRGPGKSRGQGAGDLGSWAVNSGLFSWGPEMPL